MIASDILTIPSQGQTLYGKRVSSLVGDDIKVFEDGTVIGTLKHVTGYTGFSSIQEEQKGYSRALRIQIEPGRNYDDVQEKWRGNEERYRLGG